MKLLDLLDIMDNQDEVCIFLYSKCSEQLINQQRKTVECWRDSIRLSDVPNYKILRLSCTDSRLVAECECI